MMRTDDVVVMLQYRGKLSIGDDRKRLGYAAFHWSIAIATTSYLHRYDVTDGIVLDPYTNTHLNKDDEWVYRSERIATTADIARYLGAIKIGTLPKNHDTSDAGELFKQIPLPVKDSNPAQNYVTWTINALAALQDAGFIERFEIPDLIDFALKYGDDRIANAGETEELFVFPEAQLVKRGLFSSIRRRFKSNK